MNKIKQNRPIIFDVDRTLFNTAKFIQITTEALLKILKISDNNFIEADKAYLSKLPNGLGFNPYEYTKLLSHKFGIAQNLLLKEFHNTINFKHSLYSDTLKVLKVLSKFHPIGVYSEGHLPFQIDKVENVG